MNFQFLRPGKQKGFNKKIYGFDVETYGDMNRFYCASLWAPGYEKVFFSKDETIKELKRRMFEGCYIVATNLQFDFFALFDGTDELKNFKINFRGSSLLWAETHLKDAKFSFSYDKGAKKLTFIDTLNFARMSVASLGRLIKVPKLEKPEFLGKKPRTELEKSVLVRYNLRDSEISQKSVSFFFDSFKELGASQKKTIASTSFSLFRNRYLKESFLTHKKDDLLFELKAYYGGRTEAFKRGYFKDYNYYDVNSLYPSVMMGAFPKPSNPQYSRGSIESITLYDGVSDVVVYCPGKVFPLLPYRDNGKLLFPTGKFRGVYSHVELRKARSIGYVILDIGRQLYFKENFYPFKEYVEDLYKLRLQYKRTGSPLELTAKLLLNSLYGKFGQKFVGADNFFHGDAVTVDDLKDGYELLGEYVRIKKDQNPSTCCVPIWALYTTAYGRIHLYDYLKDCDPVYCDTDSIITKKSFPTSDQIGLLKLEDRILEGIIVRPKFYAFRGESSDIVKIKGLSQALDYESFKDFLKDPNAHFTRFLKFKESLRRKLHTNQKITSAKKFGLSDEKRDWLSPFSVERLGDSFPPRLVDGVRKTEKIKYMNILKTKTGG